MYKSYVLAALNMIREELDRVMWNIHQIEYSSPFGNSAERFKCDTFEVEAYSWDDSYEQPYNFKWRDIKISWYKYLGRGMEIPNKLTPNLAAQMLRECLEALDKYEKERIKRYE
jgi:hypothetical protein